MPDLRQRATALFDSQCIVDVDRAGANAKLVRSAAIRAIELALTQASQELTGGGLKPEDLSITSYPEPTPGAMHAGIPKGVMARHLPTGIEVSCTHYRSQHQNRDACLRAIQSAITGASEDSTISETADV